MMPESKIAVLTIAFSLGILASSWCCPIAWVALIAAGVVIALFFPQYIPRSMVYVTAAMFLLGAVRYSVSCEISTSDISRFALRSDRFTASVVSDPEIMTDKVRLLCRATDVDYNGKHCKATGLVMVNLYTDGKQAFPKLNYGDRVRFVAKVYPPRDPTNPGQFSWREYLARKGVYACAYVRDPEDVKSLRGESGNIFVRWALALKRVLERSIYRIIPKREASVVLGMVLGTYSYLPTHTLNDFGRTGTLHLLAASGYNCFILLLIAGYVLKPVGLLPKWRNITVIGLVILYVMMVGPKPSLLRAALMASLWLLAPILRRTPNFKVLFFVAALILLIANPSNLFDVGFQLSFLAVWALISTAPILELFLKDTWIMNKGAHQHKGIRERMKAIPREACAAGLATISVTLYTTPIIAYYFNYFSITSLPANMALALGVPAIFAIGIIVPLVAWVPYVGSVVGFCGTRITRAMLCVVDYLGSWEHSAIAVQSPGILAVIGYYMLLFAGMNYVRSRFDT